mmetsp:Transcript_106879/g.300508  ORF Transcript_106879/g.300508 Transcript_106879/m.300508 type:complete len:207 (+) Transcript_106879:1-621(+)
MTLNITLVPFPPKLCGVKARSRLDQALHPIVILVVVTVDDVVAPHCTDVLQEVLQRDTLRHGNGTAPTATVQPPCLLREVRAAFPNELAVDEHLDAFIMPFKPQAVAVGVLEFKSLLQNLGRRRGGLHHVFVLELLYDRVGLALLQCGEKLVSVQCRCLASFVPAWQLGRGTHETCKLHVPADDPLSPLLPDEARRQGECRPEHGK